MVATEAHENFISLYEVLYRLCAQDPAQDREPDDKDEATAHAIIK